ncbi:hypothetical protein [Asticcacaulis taihuensis]|uniref:hypothetical protein n=1 Tax=Asticcacaulis taihuensis TaxID=260084 RepID=UPI0026EEDB13|nr:hypothetical protein [Asticcacaulis taihuensis]
MIKSGRLLRSLLGLIADSWLAILLIGVPFALLVNSSFDEISYFDPVFLTNYGYKGWLDYALCEGTAFFEVSLAFTILVCLLGFVIHAVLCKLNWQSLHNYLGTGVIAAGVFSLLIAFCFFGGTSAFPVAVAFSLFLIAFILSALFALMTSLVFWLIRRPDKDAAKPLP